LALQGFVKVEKLIAQMFEIIIKRLIGIACKNIFPYRQVPMFAASYVKKA
jgi:hypothetical protein